MPIGFIMINEFDYSYEKNLKLKQERGITFDEIIELIRNGFVMDIIDHPNQEKYPFQRIYVLDIDEYIWLVPYIQNGNKAFLKTAFPSRDKTKEYFEGKKNEKA